MQLIQELKSFLENLDDFSPQDFLVAESIARLFHVQNQNAKVWLVLMLNEIRQGKIFFDPSLSQSNQNYAEFFDLHPLSPFEIALESLIQKEDEKLSKPILKIENRFIFQKDFHESFSWIKEMIQLLKLPVINQEVCLESEKNLSLEQKKAIQTFFENRWQILTGGPGRGKTFTAKKIVSEYLKLYPKATIVVSAPTGKAAENLAQVVLSIDPSLEIEPKTIHSLLKISPSNLEIDEDDLIDADLLIIDECSMMDLAIFSLLVRKIRPTTCVLMIGDEDQLPPVRGISPLSILIEIAGEIENLSLSRLTIPFRTEQQGLLDLSDGILLQDEKRIKKAFLDTNLSILPSESIFKSVDEEIENFITDIKEPFDENRLYESKVITSHNVGPYGADEINQYCLKKLSYKKNRKQILVPIIFRENDEKSGIYNGKMAFYSVFADKPQVFFKNKDPLPSKTLPRFDLAFAISIHKSQGSEYRNVKIVFQNINELSQELIYTAVTRAKKSLTVFGKTEDLIAQKSRKDSDNQFYKKICVRLIEESTLKLA